MAVPLIADDEITAGDLIVSYADIGDRDAEPVVLLHGFPYDIQSFAAVAPLLVEAGYRVLVPYLRGHGGTRFRDPSAPRSGQQAALGKDLLDFIDALDLRQPVVAGFDWGGRAACVAAALWPERVGGLVSVNGYLIQNIASAGVPAPPSTEAGFWYFWYFATSRGHAGLTAYRRELAEVLWRRNSPEWNFTTEDLALTAASFENDDYVDVVIHSYRHRLGLADGDPRFSELENQLSKLPVISIPTITLEGEADGNFPATDGTAQDRFFTDARRHRRVPHAGHNLPAEAPRAFAESILDVAEAPGAGNGTP